METAPDVAQQGTVLLLPVFAGKIHFVFVTFVHSLLDVAFKMDGLALFATALILVSPPGAGRFAPIGSQALGRRYLGSSGVPQGVAARGCRFVREKHRLPSKLPVELMTHIHKAPLRSPLYLTRLLRIWTTNSNRLDIHTCITPLALHLTLQSSNVDQTLNLRH